MSPKKITICIIIPSDMNEKLLSIAQKNLTSRGQVARQLILESLSKRKEAMA